MRTLLSIGIIAAALAATSSAQAQDDGGGNTGFGVGVETMLSGPGGPAFVYQAPNFHVSAVLSFDTGVDEAVFNDDLALAGRFYYQIHSGEISDFSVGGGFGIEDGPGGGDDIDLHIEAGAQIRAFIVPNVALSATLGLAMEFDEDGGGGGGDDDLDVALTGQINALFGVTYFFF